MVWEEHVLLVLNSHPETVELLTDWFAALGATVHYGRTSELCGNAAAARDIVESTRPTVVLFDLAVPYARNWQCFQHVANSGLFGATPIVLTTVNARALDELVGPTHAFEIIGTPHDLWKLQDLIEWRLAGHAQAPRPSMQ
jgi:CheY-like chemotaxis protein